MKFLVVGIVILGILLTAVVFYQLGHNNLDISQAVDDVKYHVQEYEYVIIKTPVNPLVDTPADAPTLNIVDINIPIQDTCVDSDGENAYVLGTTKQWKSGSLYKTQQDECNGNGWVREYICIGKEMDYKDIQCTGAAGCGNAGIGYCLPLTCNDVCKWNGIFNAPFGIDSTETYCKSQGYADEYWIPVGSLPQNVIANRGCCCFTWTS